MIWLPLYILLCLVLVCAVVAIADQRRRRAPDENARISFLVPCYNDASTLRATIESVFASWPADRLEVLVANDASTDASATTIEALAREYPLRVFHHAENLGKAETLNRLADHASCDILLFVDADTILNPRSVRDLMARLARDPNIGAVSCPYQPLNKGWLPKLQAIDYSMIALLQGGYNAVSGLALWGGCIAVRRRAFDQVGRFSVWAITEDVDLAHKLNRAGWRVQQSMRPVRSWVPDTVRGWIRQKMRWTAGGFQCLARHPDVWLRNPMHVAWMATYAFLSVHGVVAVIGQIVLLGGLFRRLSELAYFLPLSDMLATAILLSTRSLTDNLLVSIAFSLLSLVYIAPLVSRWRDLAKFLLVLPFTMAYFPLYVIVSLLGLAYFLRHAVRLSRPQSRAW